MTEEIKAGLSPEMNPADVEPVVEPKGLDRFANLFDNDGKNIEKDETPAPLIDPTAMLGDEEATNALLAKMDFSKGISDDTQALLQSNDSKALLALVNDVGKQAYLQAMKHSTALNQRFIKEQLAEQAKDVTSQLTSHANDQALLDLIPEISNPLVAMGVKPFIARYTAQNPSASLEDVAAQVREYMGDLNSTINKPKKSASSPEDTEIDWLAEVGLN